MTVKKQTKQITLITWFKQRPKARKALLAVAATSVIVLVLLPVITSINRLGGYDWDIFFAYHEAMRRTILIYHQFPWWDPWISGGVPLFANPQNGVLSIETPFILVFGTIWGMKLAAVIYFIAGFWGMYWLLKELKTRLGVRLLLSYIWIFSTFVTFHFFAGHYTFLLYLLSPWLFYLSLKLRGDWRWAIALGVFIGFFLNTNLHYVTVQAMAILGIWLCVQLVVSKDKLAFLKRLAIAFAIALIMIAPKLYFANKYVSDYQYPGSKLTQQVSSVKTVEHAFLQPHQHPTQPGTNVLWWFEVSAYIGLTAMLLFVIAAARSVYDTYRQRKVNMGVAFLGTALLCFVIGLGPFAQLSPYSLLSHLPVFEAMQVPSRWFGWAILFMLLTISQLRGLQRLAQVLLLLAVAELIITQPFGKTFPYPLAPTTAPEHSFQQYENYWQGIAGPTAISNMYQAVVANYGEINGYEPLINRVTIGIPPAVCAVNIDAGCDITSSNARVNYWSPNVIRLERTGPGAITLNVNPSSYWLVNGDRIFANDRVTEPNKKFIITNPSKYIEVKIAPL